MKKTTFFLLFICKTLTGLCADGFEEVCFIDCSRVYVGPQGYYTLLDVKNSDSTVAGLIGLVNENSHLDGGMYGFNAGYEYKNPCGLFANLDFNYGQGNLTGSGHLSRYVHEYEAALLFGYNRLSGDCGQKVCTIYAGLDYLTQCYSVTALETKYRYELYRLPVGVKGCYTCSLPGADCNIGVNAAVLPQLTSLLKISELSGARWTLDRKIDVMISLPVKYTQYCLAFFVKLEPFWKRVALGASKAKTSQGTQLGIPPATWNAFGATLDIVKDF